eukprot:scaffold1170_cov158-Ochromonas_danica.AAC.20
MVIIRICVIDCCHDSNSSESESEDHNNICNKDPIILHYSLFACLFGIIGGIYLSFTTSASENDSCSGETTGASLEAKTGRGDTVNDLDSDETYWNE